MLPPRCNWCGVELRWWQMLRGTCALCYRALAVDATSPPCPQGSRWDSPPDKIGRAHGTR